MVANEEVIKLIFGFKVKYLRLQKELTYPKLSKLTNLSVSYLHDIERGKKYPKVDKINALANALDVNYDYLVSMQASKKIQPVIDLLQSDFFKIFPLELFGISTPKLLELFSNTPDKVNAFISTISKIARNYQMQNEHFYMAALRSYQSMSDNYFKDVEDAVHEFTNQFKVTISFPMETSYLEQLLHDHFSIAVNRTLLTQQAPLQKLRSYYSVKKKTLYINKQLSSAQENFLIGRELGFQFMGFKERPTLTRIKQITSFENLLNNFKASYFAVALLMNEQELIKDIAAFARLPTWQPKAFLRFLYKYDVTPEMFLQRLTNVLPHHFGINNLFFIRIHNPKEITRFLMTKELHLGGLHNPYANEREEHYCRRWVSINILKQFSLLKKDKPSDVIADAQISHYWETDNKYLCLAFSKYDLPFEQQSTSVTLGLLIDNQLRDFFRFLSDPNLMIRTVNTTCERCSMPNCDARVAAPIHLEQQEEQVQMEEALRWIEQNG